MSMICPVFFLTCPVIVAPPLYCPCRFCLMCVSIILLYLNANLSAKSLPASWGKNLFNHYMSAYIIHRLYIILYTINAYYTIYMYILCTTLNCRPLYAAALTQFDRTYFSVPTIESEA